MVKWGMKSTPKSILFRSDGFLLKGFLHLPDKNNPPLVIGLHGLLSSAASPKQISLAEACNEKGIAYFRFDHRGCGESEGDLKKVTSLEARCRDLKDAVRHLRQEGMIGQRIGLFGSSFGGTVSLSTAEALQVQAVVTFAAPVRSRFMMAKGADVTKDPKDPDVPEDQNDPGLTDTQDDLHSHLDKTKMDFDISDRLSGLHDICIFHGDCDKIVPPSHAEEIFKKAMEPKRFIPQRGGDHRMSDTKHQDHFVQETVKWFRERLVAP
jgi:alpha-beta hydrolase superfamily lysophospholipase